jgi:uncharacterized protein YfdQ (DUF2303 family)
MGRMENVDEVIVANEIAAALAAGVEIEKHRSESKRPKDLVHGAAYVILKDKDGAERVEWLKDQWVNPTFRRGTVKLDDGKSFIAYVTRHMTENSAVYGKQSPAKFVAVLDEHPAPSPSSVNNIIAPANWRHFRAEYTPAFSPEWLVWTNQDRKPFESTEKFALFLEDNAPDVIQPDAASMMEVALNFRVNQDVTYKAVQRLQDGQIDLTYQNNIDAQTTSTRTQNAKIPETFKIAVPVFAGVNSKVYEVDARFRFRLTGGVLKLWFELVRHPKVVERAFTDLWTKIGEGVKRTILLGSPE